MRKGRIYATQIAISLVMVIGLATGCAVPSSAPSGSKYPADISGQVTIAEKLLLAGRENTLEDGVFWLVNISVKNNVYEHAVMADYKDWRIVAGSDVYNVANILRVIEDRSSPMNVPIGQTGQTKIGFYVPYSLSLSDARVRYQGQEPYSYGKLTGGDKVFVYDWDSKTVIEETKEGDQPPANKEKDGHIGKIELFWFEQYGQRKQMNLKTIGFWEGSTSELIKFTAKTSPLVMNYGFVRVSEIDSDFRVGVKFPSAEALSGQYGLSGFTEKIPSWWISDPTGEDSRVLEEIGKYEIRVRASGCTWWIKIGVEQ